jgi:hypothetical protein
MPRRTQQHAFEIAALNLILHDHADIASKLTDAVNQKIVDLDDIAAEIAVLEEATRQTWPGFDGEVEVQGLSGLQYCEFLVFCCRFMRGLACPAQRSISPSCTSTKPDGRPYSGFLSSTMTKGLWSLFRSNSDLTPSLRFPRAMKSCRSTPTMKTE